MIKEMTVQELKQKMDRKENFILVDCREKDEWDAGRLPQSIFIPLSQFEQLYPEHLKDSDAEIIIQCRSGKRSLNACMMLQGEGYTNLTNLTGGILAWEEQNYEVLR